MIPLSEAIRISKNKANFNLRFGRPEDGDYTGAEAFLQAESNQAAAPAVARSSGPGSSPGSMPPATTFPGGILSARREASNRLFGPPTLPGMVPAGIKAANPEAYFDPRLGSTVIGASGRNRNARGGPTWSGNAMKGGQVMQNTNMATFGMPGPNERRPTIGGGGGGAPDMFGRQFGQPDAPVSDYEPGPAPMGTTTDGDNIGRLRMNAPNPYKPGLLGYAEGGTIMGPGGPTDDLIPAMVDGMMPVAVSNGEELTDAITKEYWGKKTFLDLKKKAHEAMGELVNPDGSNKPVEGVASKSARPPSMLMPGFAGGGSFVNPYADDPALYARRQQEARDASLATAGIADMGGGNMALNNRYGTGYAVPTTQGIPDMPGRFNNGGNTVTAAPGKGLSMVPDVLPPGPWSAPALPWEAQPQRENIAFMQRQMVPGAEGRRADDLATDTRQMALQPKGRRIITVPDARPNFGYGPGQVSAGEEHFREGNFLSPSEKDAQAAAQRNAPIQPFLDAGMKKSDIRQMMRTPQGMQTLQEMQPEQWTPIPGTDYMQGRKGQTVPMSRAGGPSITPEQIAAARAAGASVTTGDRGTQITYPAPGTGKAPKPPKIVGTTEDESGLKFNMHDDGTRSVVGTPTPNDDQKLAAFKYMTGREINPASPADWSQAYYFATGRQPPEKAATQSSQPTREFKTPEEAMKAGLKPGDRVMVGGKMATWRE